VKPPIINTLGKPNILGFGMTISSIATVMLVFLPECWPSGLPWSLGSWR